MAFLLDLRYALRTLKKSPAFSLLAITTVAVGIAANAAIFSLFYQVLLRGLPVAKPEQLVLLHVENFAVPGSASSDNNETVYSYVFYRHLRDASHSFAHGIAARSSTSVQIDVNGVAQRARAEIVSGNFFDVLGIQPRLGRFIAPSDDSIRGGNPVAVLSFDTWKTRFAESAAVLNRKLVINGQPFTIVGVAPEGFRGIQSGESRDLFIPISMFAAITPGWTFYDQPDTRWLNMLGRLAPGATRETAKAELAPIFSATLREELPQLKIQDAPRRSRLLASHIEPVPSAQGLNEMEHQWHKPLWVLMGMVSLLLLIGCANLANLLLARGVNRSRETSIRLALGATRARVTSVHLAESLLVAFGGALGGLLLSVPLARGVLRLLPSDETGGWLSATPDAPVLAFCVLLMILTAVLAGVGPAWQSTRAKGVSLLGDRSSASGSGHLSPRVRQTLVVAQIAFSIVLLSTAVLFGRSLMNLLRHSPGFRADNLLTFSVDAGATGYNVDNGLALYRRVEDRLAALPGVQSVSFASYGPLSGELTGRNIAVEGYTPAQGESLDCGAHAIAPGYFRTLGTPLISGREFDDHDHAGGQKVVIINEALARRFFANRSPLGRHMSQGSGGPLDLQIVGVAANAQNMDLREVVGPAYYVAYAQDYEHRPRIDHACFFVRAQSSLDALSAAARSIVSQSDRNLPVYGLQSMETAVSDSIYTDRLLAALATAFGLLALLLTAIGLYGVIMYVVSRRTAEIGIRMALGAERRDVLGLILREVAVLIVAGAAAGLAGSLLANRALAAQLFGLQGFDAIALSAAVLTLAIVALAAGAIPAIRASRIQPLVALRHD